MNSPLPYIGGKSRLAQEIIKLIPAHTTYVEVFSGAAWVFFRKDPSKVEIINDKDSELVAFYRVLQNHLEEFLKQFKWLLTSREWWNDWKNQLDAGGLTDIQKAARYYYVQRQCFGGRVKGRTFGTAASRAVRVNLLRMEEELSEVHLRLSRVMIEHLDYADLITKYDKSETFFYLDPPYYKMPYYKHNFVHDDFTRLESVLSAVSGKFIMSINDHPEIHQIFNHFTIKKIKVHYSVSKDIKELGNELLISNF